MKLIIGLGNPGQQYAKNRHNLGFMALDALALGLGVVFINCKRTLAQKAIGQINGQKVILAKPQTFMNESGLSAAKFSSYYKIKPEDIWVIYDDIDLPLAKIRIRTKGSAGGHQGIASLIKHLKTERFNRLKIGLGSNREKNLPAEVYVLQNFSPTEKAKINTAIQEGLEKLKKIIK
ncbi:MAG: aminoacyl-tRNA hydrolase [Patescibacteria group bacterium]